MFHLFSFPLSQTDLNEILYLKYRYQAASLLIAHCSSLEHFVLPVFNDILASFHHKFTWKFWLPFVPESCRMHLTAMYSGKEQSNSLWKALTFNDVNSSNIIRISAPFLGLKAVICPGSFIKESNQTRCRFASGRLSYAVFPLLKARIWHLSLRDRTTHFIFQLLQINLTHWFQRQD